MMLKKVLAYYGRKLFLYVFTIWGAFTITFFLFHSLPTNPVDSWLAVLETNFAIQSDDGAELIAYYKEVFGLEGTIWQQYTRWMYNVFVKQELGPSFVNYPDPVEKLILERIPWTLGLLSVSIALAWVLGMLIGGAAGWFRDSIISEALTNLSIALSRVPPYLIAVFLVLFLGYQWKILPTRGAFDPGLYTKGWNWGFIKSVLTHSILPALAIVIVSVSAWILSTRSLVVSTLGEDYLLYAEAKGLKPRDVLIRYALRNTMLPQVTGLALTLGAMMNGQLLIEIMFVYPGLGELTSLALALMDFNTLQGIILISIFTVMTASLVVDIVLPLLDPRIRTTMSA
jgi:peptide/nickel transport system permease protein